MKYLTKTKKKLKTRKTKRTANTTATKSAPAKSVPSKLAADKRRTRPKPAAKSETNVGQSTAVEEQPTSSEDKTKQEPPTNTERSYQQPLSQPIAATETNTPSPNLTPKTPQAATKKASSFLSNILPWHHHSTTVENQSANHSATENMTATTPPNTKTNKSHSSFGNFFFGNKPIKTPKKGAVDPPKRKHKSNPNTESPSRSSPSISHECNLKRVIQPNCDLRAKKRGEINSKIRTTLSPPPQTSVKANLSNQSTPTDDSNDEYLRPKTDEQNLRKPSLTEEYTDDDATPEDDTLYAIPMRMTEFGQW